MKKVIIFIAFALFLKPIFPVVDYVVNYEYITKTLCINKAKPQMQCNGKCHLMQELAKAAESEKPISSDKKDNAKQPSEELFFQDIQPLVAVVIQENLKKLSKDQYANLYCYTLNHSVFHPPTFIA